MSYTMFDSPAVVNRIEIDLERIVQTVREGDPSLRSLVLTGGFARGEGTVLRGLPQNDYDLIAIRDAGRLRTSYARMRRELEQALGLHVDLAPVARWRLRFVGRSIFWYETALRGRVLWGDDVLSRIPVRSATHLDRREGLRLLTNRAAGLLLATRESDEDAVRLQATKALLAALDAHLLAEGQFPPSQTERWAVFGMLRAQGRGEAAAAHASWFEWAYRMKADPAAAPRRDARDAWLAARLAILDAVPWALRAAGLRSLDEYAKDRGVPAVIGPLLYAKRSAGLGVPRLVRNATGRVRVATLRLLEATPDAIVRPDRARECFGSLASEQDPLRRLEALRAATLQ